MIDLYFLLFLFLFLHFLQNKIKVASEEIISREALETTSSEIEIQRVGDTLDVTTAAGRFVVRM